MAMNSSHCVKSPHDRSGSSLNVYISGNAIEPTLHVPGLEHQNVSAFGCVDCLMEGWSKRLPNLAAVQVNLDGTDRRGIEVNMGRNKKWRGHVIAILRTIRGENRRTDVSLRRAATIKKRLEVDAVLIDLAVNVPGNHRHGVLTGGDRSGCSQDLVWRTERRTEVRERGTADIDANVVNGSQSLEAERELQVLRNNFCRRRGADAHTHGGRRTGRQIADDGERPACAIVAAKGIRGVQQQGVRAVIDGLEQIEQSTGAVKDLLSIHQYFDVRDAARCGIHRGLKMRGLKYGGILSWLANDYAGCCRRRTIRRRDAWQQRKDEWHDKKNRATKQRLHIGEPLQSGRCLQNRAEQLSGQRFILCGKSKGR